MASRISSVPETIPARPRINLGNGDGTFQAAQTVAGAGPDGLTVADMNQDGFVDLITGEDKFVHVQFNQEVNGTFPEPRPSIERGTTRAA